MSDSPRWSFKGRRKSVSAAKTQREVLRAGIGAGQDEFIPLRLDIIDKLLSEIHLRGVETEGIFRVSGNNAVITELWRSFASRTVDEIDVSGIPIHDVAGALKLYLRHQVEPLVPFELFDPVCNAFSEADGDPEKQLSAVLESLQQLPPENQPIFRRLWPLLGEVVKNSERSKMDSKNLSIVFGPMLMRPAVTTFETELVMGKIVADLLDLMIRNHRSVMMAFPKVVSSFNMFGRPPSISDMDWNLVTANASVVVHYRGQPVVDVNAPSQYLYRVIRGFCRVTRNDVVLQTVGPDEIVAEDTFLGRINASAAVLASENGTELYKIPTSYLNDIFAVEWSLASRFYWNIARDMAARYLNLSRKFSLFRVERDVSKVFHAIRLYTEEQGRVFVSVPYEQSTTFSDVVKQLEVKMLVEDRSFYLASGDGEAGIVPLNDFVSALAKVMTRMNGSRLYFTNSPPIALTDNTEADKKTMRVYPCSYRKISGVLILRKNQMIHSAKTLGIARDSSFEYSKITELDVDGSVVELRLHGKSKRVRFHMKTIAAACQLRGLVNVLLKSVSTLVLGNTESSSMFRVVALQDNESSDPLDLSFRRADCICVTNQLDDETWEGYLEKSDSSKAVSRSGRFPAKFVQRVRQDALHRRLIEEGYRNDFRFLPSNAEWRLLLRGSKEITYQRGEVIIERGSPLQRLLHITKGTCDVETTMIDEDTGLQKVKHSLLEQGEVFGEISFLAGGDSDSVVRARSDNVVAVLLEAEYIKRMLNKDAGMAARFFKYLATIVERRLRTIQLSLCGESGGGATEDTARKFKETDKLLTRSSKTDLFSFTRVPSKELPVIVEREGEHAQRSHGLREHVVGSSVRDADGDQTNITPGSTSTREGEAAGIVDVVEGGSVGDVGELSISAIERDEAGEQAMGEGGVRSVDGDGGDGDIGDGGVTNDTEAGAAMKAAAAEGGDETEAGGNGEQRIGAGGDIQEEETGEVTGEGKATGEGVATGEEAATGEGELALGSAADQVAHGTAPSHVSEKEMGSDAASGGMALRADAAGAAADDVPVATVLHLGGLSNGVAASDEEEEEELRRTPRSGKRGSARKRLAYILPGECMSVEERLEREKMLNAASRGRRRSCGSTTRARIQIKRARSNSTPDFSQFRDRDDESE